jgi:hypothetical protein
MRKFHELAADDHVWTESAALTVGSVARALSDSKTALAASRKLDDRLGDVDELLADIAKSNAVLDDCIKSIEAKGRALDEEIAKIKAAPDVLAKMAAWERSFFERQWAGEVAKGRSGVDFETYLLQIEFSRQETIRKRAERDDDDSEAVSTSRFDAQYRVVR